MSDAMTSGHRLDGGLIDRSIELLPLDGKSLEGHGGDTLASALLANGVRPWAVFQISRSARRAECRCRGANAIVALREGAFTEPNTRATTAELFDGLVNSQNRWPSRFRRGGMTWCRIF